VADPMTGAGHFAEFFQIHMQVPYLINERCIEALQNCPELHGNIIHITDIYVHKPAPNFRTYCATKAGLQSLNDSYAQCLAPDIRVNAIQPGPLAFLPEHSEAAQRAVMASTPLKRLGGFEPVIQTVDFILQNDYLTGASINVDGGRMLGACRT
ncbi:MAG: SDR family oxidoreductase, partial [Natronospirillum sp.]